MRDLMKELMALDPDLKNDGEDVPEKELQKEKKVVKKLTQTFDSVIHETAKARLYRIGDKQFWLPKARTKVTFAQGEDGIGHVDYPEWLNLKITAYKPMKRRDLS